MKSFLFFLIVLGNFSSYAQNINEYLKVRVQYKIKFGQYDYEVYVDIGKNGSHSLAGKVENMNEKVKIHDDNGLLEFESDIDILNYLGEQGWQVIQSNKNKILDTEYTEYLLEKQHE
ncbi:hypothetical protein [Crocinitomix algicola]|uniref:hypothetical protein n=1 Tax=Crocinitomix algicola TaxID=1740263 RepID=UPI00082E3841|nr:hypothetical protein [Crocinitomix algicola]